MADGISIDEAVFASTLKAVVRAGSLADKRVMVTSCGPIGVHAIIGARAHGAWEIVAADVVDAALTKARDWNLPSLNVGGDQQRLAAYSMGSTATFPSHRISSSPSKRSRLPATEANR